jgi:hypothetical protein
VEILKSIKYILYLINSSLFLNKGKGKKVRFALGMSVFLALRGKTIVRDARGGLLSYV